MKITFVLPVSDLSGGNRVLAIYADLLQRRGHRVTVVSRPKRVPTRVRQLKSLLRGRPVPLRVPFGPSHIDGIANIAYKRIDRVRPITAGDVPDADVVIATWWETAEWVASFPASKGAKVYFIQHFEVFPNQPADRVQATWRLPIQKITIARWLVDLARDRFDDPTAILVPNAVDAGQFHAPPRDKQPVATVGLMYSEIPFKGCDISLKAIELATKRLGELAVVAFGQHPPTPALPLPPNVNYTVMPDQTKIRDLYAAADVWLVGSRSEGFGLPILEAMACRTPVIATPTGAAPELLGNGGGTLVPMENPPAMADAIVNIVSLLPERWREMSDNAHRTATQYSWDDAVIAFEAAIEKATHKPPV